MKVLQMIFTYRIILFLLAVLLPAESFATAPPQKQAKTSTKKSKKKKGTLEAKETGNFSSVDLLVQEQINNQAITGAVLLVGHDGRIVHQKAFGLRAIVPHPEPMTLVTIFDFASLHKVVATALS